MDSLLDALRDEAGTAEEVGSALYSFLNLLPDYSADISAVISHLFGISSVLQKLEVDLPKSRYHSSLDLVFDDVRVALESLSMTLIDVERHFERLGITAHPGAPAFKRVWREIQSALGDDAITFLDRLENFKDFFVGLTARLRGSGWFVASEWFPRG